MQPIPGYSNIFDQGYMTEVQLNVFVAILYLTTVIYLCELAMALYNFWVFLIKQRKYKTWPLLMFYVIAIALISMRIYCSIFFFYESQKN